MISYMTLLITTFQSTLPRGSDNASASASLISTHISIHAPSRERPTSPQRSITSADFNPRSLAGATCISVSLMIKRVFQSTLPRGSDTNSGVIPSASYIFQSTLPRGSDQPHRNAPSRRQISIHAPSRERHVSR